MAIKWLLFKLNFSHHENLFDVFCDPKYMWLGNFSIKTAICNIIQWRISNSLHARFLLSYSVHKTSSILSILSFYQWILSVLIISQPGIEQHSSWLELVIYWCAINNPACTHTHSSTHFYFSFPTYSSYIQRNHV